jgi:tetratricopeptide (TPR) repeat protein
MKRAIGCVMLSVALFGCANGNSGRGMADRAADGSVKDVPINAETRYAAAQLAVSRGEYDQAIDQYRAALKLKPNHLGALYGLACLQVELRQFPQAIDTWHSYVKATGGSAIAYCDLAFAEEWAGKPAAAQGDYQRAINKDPQDENTRVNYGLMLARAGDIDGATEQLSAVLPKAEVHYNLASVYAARGKKLQAKAEYQKALELDPDMSDAKAKLASLDQD